MDGCSVVKTGRWGGVVTAFITMSDVKDEIDWEFPGANTTQAQSNYFWQGVIGTLSIARTLYSELLYLMWVLLVANPSNGAIHSGLTDTFSNYHDYTVRIRRFFFLEHMDTHSRRLNRLIGNLMP
jgi:beta-glucanase (GH16 family)